MTEKTSGFISAAIRGARRGALVGFALPFVTGAAFSVVTWDDRVFFDIIKVGTITETIIVWSTVWVFSVCFGAVYAGLSVIAEIRRRRAIEREFDALVSGEDRDKKRPNKSVNSDRLFRWRSKSGRLR